MHSLDDKHPTIKKFYLEGKANEVVVADWLRELGYEVKRAGDDEDFYHDVDLWARKVGGTKWFAVSVKANEPQYFHNPFCFELERKGRYDWMPSWYQNSKADVYIIWKRNSMNGGELWFINKRKLVKYVNENGWTAETGHKKEVSEREKNNNLFGVRLGLLSKHLVEEKGLGRMLSTKKSIIKKREA